MLTKEGLLKQFQREPEKFWKVELFSREGFKRKVCVTCNKGFWTLDEFRTICPEHETYGFIDKPITKSKWNYLESWNEFQKFFKKRNHTPIPRYPIISRWHPNLFFTQASVQDFQRFDNNTMSFDYPENPLIVPQMCLRFNDIPNVGVTGKHLTCFMMSGQHAFNDGSGKGYWKDKCLELNFEFLTKVIGIPKNEIVYLEDIWAMTDLSAFGPCIEAHSKGLEIVNNVFMEFAGLGTTYKELPMKVIDVGWGLERIPWFTQGTPTMYDAIFDEVIKKIQKTVEAEYDTDLFLKYSKFAGLLNIDEVTDLKKTRREIAKQLNVSVEELERKVAPIEAIYAIVDHSRALAFAIADGGLPSNVGGGYNLRIILRRALSFIEKFNWQIKLEDVAIWHAKSLKKLFPELLKSEDEIVKILQVEEKRYKQTQERTRKIITSLANREIPEEELTRLYESEGITPEQLGVEVPSDFYEKLTGKHMGQKEEKEKFEFDVPKISPTKILYYEEPYVFEFEAKVEKVLDDNFVVLNQTAFYPTSGGQMYDTGFVDSVAVTDVFKIGNVVVHRLFGKAPSIGKVVKCQVDKTRREILMKHHDAVHIVNGVARKVLGKHVHQYGAEKDLDKARLDITHYESLTEKQVEQIEKAANQIVEKSLPIKKIVMNRGEAEQKYGFDIYAGGYVPSKEIRLVEIPKHDIEACGGTHGSNTRDVGWVIITKTKRIADGLVRIEMKAGEVAEKNLQENEKILKQVAQQLNVKEKSVPSKVQKIFDEWKKLRKKK